MRPAWFKLLLGHEKNPLLPGTGFGLSLSFLVGALRETPNSPVDEAQNQKDLRTLIRSMMIDTPDNYIVRISRCDTRGFTVTKIIRDGDVRGSYNVVKEDGSESRLYAWSEYFSSAKRDIESIFGKLWEECKDPICQARYSMQRGGGSKPFTPEERVSIAEWSKMPDDDLEEI